jgi:hypothetical protein
MNPIMQRRQRREVIAKDTMEIIQREIGHPFKGFTQKLSERMELWSANERRISLLKKRVELNKGLLNH